MIEVLSTLGKWLNIGIAFSGAAISFACVWWWVFRKLAVHVSSFQLFFEFCLYRKKFKEWLNERER